MLPSTGNNEMELRSAFISSIPKDRCLHFHPFTLCNIYALGCTFGSCNHANQKGCVPQDSWVIPAEDGHWLRRTPRKKKHCLAICKWAELNIAFIFSLFHSLAVRVRITLFSITFIPAVIFATFQFFAMWWNLCCINWHFCSFPLKWEYRTSLAHFILFWLCSRRIRTCYTIIGGILCLLQQPTMLRYVRGICDCPVMGIM